MPDTIDRYDAERIAEEKCRTVKAQLGRDIYRLQSAIQQAELRFSETVDRLTDKIASLEVEIENLKAEAQ